MKKNVAGQKIGAQMVSATDGSAFTGAVTVAVTGDAGTQATGSVGSGACTHEGNGFHTYAPAQAETNYDHIAFTFTGSGAVPVTVQVFPSFPQSADVGTGTGLTAIPWNAAWDAEVQSECADALNAYDPPTNAELVAEINAVQTDIAALNDLDSTAVQTAAAAALTAYDPPTKAELDSAVAPLALEATVAAVDDYVDTEVGTISTNVSTLLTRLGTPTDLGGGATVAANLSDIEGQTDALPASFPANFASLAITAGGAVTAGTVSDKTGYTASSVGAGAITAASFAAGALDAAALAADACTEIADAILKRDFSSVTGESARSLINAARLLRNKWSIAAGTMTVTKEDDTTAAWTSTVTTAAGNPVTGNDPA